MKLILSGIAVLALVAACGDDSSGDDSTVDSGSTESSGESDTTGESSGDDSETTDSAGDDSETSGDAGGTDLPEPLTCGDAVCPVPTFGTSCCVTAADVEANAAFNEGVCGIDLSAAFGGPSQCVELNQPGEVDESCPGLEVEGQPPVYRLHDTSARVRRDRRVRRRRRRRRWRQH
jgi:hypothetical protein